MIVLRNQGRQCGVRDIICSVKAGIEKRIRDEKPCVLGKFTDTGRNHKDCHQANRTSEVAVKHPGTRLSHPAVSLVNHGAKENVTDSVKKLGNRDQGPGDPCIQPDRIGQVNHDKG